MAGIKRSIKEYGAVGKYNQENNYMNYTLVFHL